MAHSTQNTLDADAGQLLRYLQRGGTKSYYLTFDADGHAHATWYNSGDEPPAVPPGTNVYFGVSPCTAIPETNAAGKPAKPENVRGRVENIAVLNCLYAEFDAKDFGGMVHGFPLGALEHIGKLTTFTFPPSITVNSGGGYHCYWLLAKPFVLDTPEKREQAIAMQRDWVTFVGGDKAAKDIARVLRVPGTLNYKYEPARPVAFYEQAYSRLHHIQILELELDDWRQATKAPVPRKARAPRPNAPACHTDGLPPGVAQPSVDFLAISKAAAALARLRVERRDEYTGWLHVGMALKGLGAIGYELWRAWSESSPKYNVGDCERKWQTFRVGVPGSTDITLASLYRYADEDGEPVSNLDDAERRQLDAYKARDVQTQRILTMKAPLAAKAVWLGMLPTLETKQALMANKDGHTGSLAVNYGNFAEKMNTNKKSVGSAVELGERAGLWRKDAEYKETNAGFDIALMRLDLQPAFFRPELAEPIPETRGGKRAGAGRKPKCADCPPRTRVLRRTEITYVCDGCGQVLDAEPTRYDVLPDDAPAAAEFKTETDVVPSAARLAEHADEFKIETEYIGGTTTVSVLKKTHAELVPVALTETYDTAAALRLADSYAPDDAAERLAYKTGLTWLQRGEHAKAAALAANVHDERAHAILVHLAERPPTLAPV